MDSSVTSRDHLVIQRVIALVYKKYTLKEPDSRLRPIELSGCKIKLDLDSGLERPTAIILIVHQPDAKPSKLDPAARLTVVKGIIRPV